MERGVGSAKREPRPDDVPNRAEPPVLLWAADGYVARTRQHRSTLGGRPVADVVQHHVEASASVDDVGGGVVDDGVRAERSDRFDIAGTADGVTSARIAFAICTPMQSLSRSPTRRLTVTRWVPFAITPSRRAPRSFIIPGHVHLNGYTGSSFDLVLDLILDGLSRLSAESNER
jgi:hypothetical protein